MRSGTPFIRLALALYACLAAFTSCNMPYGPSGANQPDYESFRAECVDRINAFRASEGLPALSRWKDAESCSDGEARSDSETGKAHSAFGTCKEWAQDECPGWGSAQSTVDGCLQSMWDERLNPNGEQGHYRNMSNAKYKSVACGFYKTPDGKVWALQNFK
jgi:hypothetical protein